MKKPGTQEEHAVWTAQCNFRKSSSRNAPFIPMLCPSNTRAQISPVKRPESRQVCVTQHGESITGSAPYETCFLFRLHGDRRISVRCRAVNSNAQVASPISLHGSSALEMPRLEQTKRWLQKPVRIASHGPSVPLVCLLYSGGLAIWLEHCLASQSCTPWLRVTKRAAANAGNAICTRVTPSIGRRFPVRLT